MGTKTEDNDDDDDLVKVKRYGMVNLFVEDDTKVDDIKFDKLAVAETVDKEVEPMLTIHLESLTGRSLLLPVKEDGTCDHAKIIKIYDECQKILANEPNLIKLQIKVNNEEYGKLVAYNKMNDFIEK